MFLSSTATKFFNILLLFSCLHNPILQVFLNMPTFYAIQNLNSKEVKHDKKRDSDHPVPTCNFLINENNF